MKNIIKEAKTYVKNVASFPSKPHSAGFVKNSLNASSLIDSFSFKSYKCKCNCKLNKIQNCKFNRLYLPISHLVPIKRAFGHLQNGILSST